MEVVVQKATKEVEQVVHLILLVLDLTHMELVEVVVLIQEMVMQE